MGSESTAARWLDWQKKPTSKLVLELSKLPSCGGRTLLTMDVQEEALSRSKAKSHVKGHACKDGRKRMWAGSV